MTPTFVPEIVYLAVFVLQTQPEEVMLVRPARAVDLSWQLPSIDASEFEDPLAAVCHLIDELSVSRKQRQVTVLRERTMAGGFRAQSYRVNITPAERDIIGSKVGSYQILFARRHELKGPNGSGYLGREERRLLSP